MFERWLSLWRETAQKTLNEAGAAGIVVKAERIAESLQLGMYFRPGEGGTRARD
jgi:hemoglobin